MIESLKEIRSSFQEKKMSPVDLSEKLLSHCKAHNDKLNAVVELNPNLRTEAEQLGQWSQDCGPLWGVPVIIKDNICVQNIRATAASKILDNFVAPTDASCVKSLRDAGALILGKANLDEFGMGSSNENSTFGVCRNPWDQARTPGGSSGGSAAAVAANFSPISLGTDTGGSVRQPASYCGLVGVKPTYGSISRYGVISYASSLDQVGVLARNVADAATTLDVLIVQDPKDATSVCRNIPTLANLQHRPLKGARIALPEKFLTGRLNQQTHDRITKLVESLRKEGAVVEPVELPHAEFAVATYYLIAACEASSNLSRYDGVRYGRRARQENEWSLSDLYERSRSEGFGEEVKRRILLGTFALSADSFESFYLRAAKVRRLIQQDFQKVFAGYDLMISPVSTDSAFLLGEKIKDPIAMYENDVFTTPQSLSGLPSMSLPLGLDDQSLPMGLQLTANAFQEDSMLAFALSIEELIGFKESARGFSI